MIPTAISGFLVAKLYPNDLVTIMNGIYPFPINRGHWSFVFHKKYIQVSSFSKEKKSLLAFIFKVLSIAEVFSWFPSLLLLFNWNFSLTLLLEPKIILHSIRDCKREFVVFWSPSDYCTCGYTTSGLEECDWGVGYSLVIVILCENYSGSEILLGEGGDVELGARISKQISLFAIGLLVPFSFYSFILILSIYTLTIRLHCAPQNLI